MGQGGTGPPLRERREEGESAVDVKKTSSVGCPTALCERSFRKVKYHIREALFAPRGRWGGGGAGQPKLGHIAPR